MIKDLIHVVVYNAHDVTISTAWSIIWNIFTTMFDN